MFTKSVPSFGHQDFAVRLDRVRLNLVFVVQVRKLIDDCRDSLLAPRVLVVTVSVSAKVSARSAVLPSISFASRPSEPVSRNLLGASAGGMSRSTSPPWTSLGHRVELELVNQTDVEISLNWIGHTRCEVCCQPDRRSLAPSSACSLPPFRHLAGGRRAASLHHSSAHDARLHLYPTQGLKLWTSCAAPCGRRSLHALTSLLLELPVQQAHLHGTCSAFATKRARSS